MKNRNIKFSWWELWVALGIIVITAGTLLPALSRGREAARRASCQNNLKQLGLVVKMYANESNGSLFPPLSPIRDNWMMDMKAVYPEYLTDLNIFKCPSSPYSITFQQPECVSSLYYNYTQHNIYRDEQALALFEAYQMMPFETFMDGDLELMVPVWESSSHLGAGSKAQSTIPIMWDRVPLEESEFPHRPMGINILFMDGHVEFMRYSFYNNVEYFPATRLSAETFGASLPRMPQYCYDAH